MLQWLDERPSDRKLRLFAVACCRCSRQLMRNEDLRRDLEVAARFADGLATAAELAAACERSNGLALRLYDYVSEREIHRWAEATAVANATRVVTKGYHMVSYAWDAAWNIGRAAHRNLDSRLADLLRDIMANPFCPLPTIGPSWLVWKDGVVVKLAQRVYDDWAFDCLPILGDALEDAGCHNGDILAHCRQAGPHSRGCWVLDLLLGKQ
jgi:hypothetical protein